MRDYRIHSNKMVEEQIKTRGIKSESVLEAMRNLPRHLFVAENLRDHAYNDSPLPIGRGQTISQPYIVAFMTEQLEPVPGMRILEIGLGSGYQAAVLAHIGCEVYSVELLKELADEAKKTLDSLKIGNVKIKHGDGYKGWLEEAPFDAVIVTAAPKRIPEKLVEQLKEGGKVQLVGFGTFEAVERAAKEGRNPQTGEPMKIAACKAPKFKAGKALKDALN